MPTSPLRLRIGLYTLLAAGMALAAGCDKSQTSHSNLQTVAGYVKVGGTPLPIGTVTFHPDEAKGNKLKEKPFGVISQDGSYKVLTGGQEGVPLGWYKVTVQPTGMPKEMPPLGQPMPKGIPFNPKHQKPETSGIAFEVVENPKQGAYDIDLTK